MTGSEGRRAEILATLIAHRLAVAYNRSPSDSALVASLCDEGLDRSGNLLGWLREYAGLVKVQEDAGALAKEGHDGDR